MVPNLSCILSIRDEKCHKAIMLIILTLATFACKSVETPPDNIIEEAKQHTRSILEKVKSEKSEVQGPVELVDEYYNGYSKKYVLEYHIENETTPTVKDIRKAYIVKKGDQWYYEFEFDQKYSFVLPKESR